MHGHYLLLLGNCDQALREKTVALLKRDAADWFNYTPDAWLLCLPEHTARLRQGLYHLFQGSPAYFLLANVDNVQVRDGVLPDAAWKWLRTHHLMSHLNPK